MNHDEPELVWQGRLHLGDGPGVYGDAPYVGLSVDLPLMLRRFPDAEETASGTLVIEIEGLHPRTGSTGPTLTVAHYAARAADGAFADRMLLEQPLSEPITGVPVKLDGDRGSADHVPISVRLRTNTDTQPGLYADFVLVAIRFECTTHYATLGFQTAT